MNAFSKIVSIIIGIVILFFIPIIYFAEKQDNLTEIYVLNQTSYFIDTIRNCGYLSKEMYEDYIENLDKTQLLYEIQLEHSHHTIDAEYDNNNIFLNDYITYNSCVYEDEILKELFDGSGKYTFTQGDTISITVQNRIKTYAERLETIIFHTTNNHIIISYGGEIRDENY